MSLMVSINGSPRRNSRTGELIDAVCRAIRQSMAIERASINLADEGRRIMLGLTRQELDPRGEEVLRLIERADLLVVGSPVYRASYTGLMKHLFDLVEGNSLRNCPAVLIATGGTPLHGLMLEHQLRPLMSFFGMRTLPTCLYALESDIEGGVIVGPDLKKRLLRVVGEAVAAMSAYSVSEANLKSVA